MSVPLCTVDDCESNHPVSIDFIFVIMNEFLFSYYLIFVSEKRSN